MTKTKRRTALVVGAGIGGPVLAMWLEKIGYEVLVTEARDAVAHAEGAFLGVAPNGMHVLDALGVLDATGLAGGHPCRAFRFADARGRVVGSIDRSRDREELGWPLTMVRRGELHAHLARAAAGRGVELRYGHRLRAIDTSNPECVSASFENGAVVQADLLVGCDGLRSASRRLAVAPEVTPTFSGMLDCGGFARVKGLALEPGVNHMVFGKRAFFGAFTTGDGETWWFHNGPPEDAPDLRARLLELHRDDPPWISEVLRATPTILGPWRLEELDPMPRWSEGRVCLLGDAAHAMSPSAGQGASLAMEDAMVLAQCLRDIADVPASFARFEALRRPRVEAIARAAARQGSNKVPSALGAWMRDRMLPFFLRLGAAQQTKSYAFRIEFERSVAA